VHNWLLDGTLVEMTVPLSIGLLVDWFGGVIFWLSNDSYIRHKFDAISRDHSSIRLKKSREFSGKL
jgi:hypothetical protein